MEVSGKRDGDLSFSQLHGSDDVSLYCQPCNQDQSLVPAYGYCQNCAEHLCETCYKSHRKPAPCRNHVLLDKQQMPQTQSSLPPTLPAPSDLTEMCEQHPGKVIEYYCKDHNVLGCSPCVTMRHRTCKIDYIPEVSSKYVGSSEYEDLLQSLRSLHESFKKITEAAKDNKQFVLKNGNTVKEDIKRFRQDVNNALDKWEAEVHEGIEKLIAEERRKAESAVKQSQNLAQRIETTHDVFKKLEQDGKINMLYIQGKKNKESLNEFQSAEQRLQHEGRINRVTFQPNLAITNLLQTEKSLGNVTIHPNESYRSEQLTGGTQAHTSNIQKPVTKVTPPSYKDISAKSAGQINVKTANDKLDCSITGIAVIGTDKLALADHKNKSIKILDIKQKTIIDDLQLSSTPWDVVQLPEYQLAVFLYKEELIQIVKYHNGLSKLRQLKAGGRCYGSTEIEGNIIVSYGVGSVKAKIMSLNGTVLKTLYTSESDSGSCFYTATDRENACTYVSHFNDSKVICLNKKGTVNSAFSNEKLRKPCGLAVLEDGSILLCNSGNNNIFLISADFKSSRIILQEKDGIVCPYSLALDSTEKKLYIGSGKLYNYINVYGYK